ncbi:MAG: protein kinase, partial [Verrucomicrobia bacterium]|nr:protein kinase [Verrucomicrobiota bacterium]
RASHTSPYAPPRVPDHELLRRIGRGAYGEVWLARSVTGAFRAVKIVHRQSFDHERPFEREFEGILKFEPVSRTHDSQVDILHVGRGDDCFYYLMELADDQATGGQINPDNYTPRTLKSDLLFHGRLPFEECVRIGVALATALESLHGNGLVHRDVKPSNIIFVNGVPKLADIGLVTGVDATRSYVGTEGFAAPEGAGTPQADLYSLGKVLHEAATGKDRQEFPELPTQLRELPDRDGLMELNAVIARACRHDPKDRYASATAMRADLELLQSGKSLARLHRTEKRLRFVQRAGAVVTAIAALIAAGWLWQTRQTHKLQELATEKAALADENRERIVRLDIATGVELLDEGDLAGSLLWFADALSLVKSNAAAESIQRIRIQQVLNQMPRLLQVKAETSGVLSSAFSPDGRRAAIGTRDGLLRAWDIESGKDLWKPIEIGEPLFQVRFTPDGRYLLASSSPPQGNPVAYPPAHSLMPAASDFKPEKDRYFWYGPKPIKTLAAVIEVEAGHPVFPSLTNLVRADFSPDGRYLAVADTTHIIRVLNVTNGASVIELPGHTEDISMFSFSGDASWLASASWDCFTRFWRLPSGKSPGEPKKLPVPHVRAVMSHDGRRALLGTVKVIRWDKKVSTVRTMSNQTGDYISPPTEFPGQVHALAFDKSEKRLLVSGEEYFVRVLDSDTHAEILPPLRMNGVARSCAFHPDGRSVAIGSEDGTARIWSLETGELLFPPFHHTGWLESGQFSPDGDRLLTTSDDGTARLWELQLAAEAGPSMRFDSDFVKLDPRDFVLQLGSSEQRRKFVIGLADGTVRLIDGPQLKQIHKLVPEDNDGVPRWSQLDNTETQVAANRVPAEYRMGRETGETGKSEAIDLWRIEGESIRHLVLPHPAPVNILTFSHGGETLVTWGSDSKIRIWKTADGSLQRTFPLPEGYSADGGLSPGARLGFFRHREGFDQLFDIASGQPLGERVRTSILGMSFDPAGERFATVGADQSGRIWSALTGKPLTPPFKHGGILTGGDFSPDGTRFVTVGLSPVAKIWDAKTGEMLLSPMNIGHKPMRTASWSLDSRFIVARSDDNLVRVWDAATAEPVTPLLPHKSYIRAAFMGANNRLGTFSDPNVLRTWDLTETKLKTDVIVDYAKLVSGRELNPGGVLRPLKADELERLHRSLLARAPQLFQ